MARPKQIGKKVADRIRNLYAAGNCTQKQLAIQFGLSQSTVCKIINNYIHRYTNIVLSGEAEVRVGYKYGN